MQSFLQNRPRVAATVGRVFADGTRSDAASDAAANSQLEMLGASLLDALPSSNGRDVSVEAIKEGDRVTKLVVTCRCGERIEILCAYGPGGR